MIFKDDNHVRIFDAIALFESISKSKNEDKLKDLLVIAGVEHYDEERTLVKKPSVGILGFGGISFDLSSSISNKLKIRNSSASMELKDLTKIFEPLQAVGGFMSYLNSGSLDTGSMIDVMRKYEHFSTLHLSYINIGIFGISSLVENEFNSQRDLIHLARITEARTSIQNNPPLVVLYPEHTEHFRETYKHIQNRRSKIKKSNFRSKKDFLESINSIFPASKATALIVSVTFRNLIKIVDMLEDQGKEEEMKRVLALINNFSNKLWPKFFKKTSLYGYALPKHWQK